MVILGLYKSLKKLNNFLLFRQERIRLRMSTEKFKKFKVIAIKHNRQVDGCNCGVHVIEV